MRHGGNVWAGDPARCLDFSANLRPEGPPDWVISVMRGALAHARYYPDPAMTAARKGLAEWLGVPTEWVLPTAGGAAAIDLALSLDRGRVLLHPPTFGEYALRARARGRDVVMDTEGLLPGDTLVRCNPNNPTGEALPVEAMLALHRKATACGGTLMVDEAFIDFCPECSLRRSLRPGLVIVGSLTKTLCIPGVRLGYVLAQPDIIRRLSEQALPWQLNMLASAICAALPEHQAEIARDRQQNEARRERFAAQLTARGAHVAPSKANFLLVDFGRDMTKEAERLKRERVLVRTCESFGLPNSFWRLSVKRDEENERLVKLLWPDERLRRPKEEFSCGENR